MASERAPGFTLIEVLVALAILALAFGFGYRALSGGLAFVGRAGQEERAVSLARSELSRVGRDIALQQGTVERSAADGLRSEIAMSPVGVEAGGLAGYRVEVTVRWRKGGLARQVRLETIRLAPSAAGEP